MTLACARCVFYKSDSDGYDAAKSGECRAHAPSVQQARPIPALWPKVKGDDWCGEFIDKYTKKTARDLVELPNRVRELRD